MPKPSAPRVDSAWWSTGLIAWLSAWHGEALSHALAYAVCVTGACLAAGTTLPRLEAARAEEGRTPVAFTATLTILPVLAAAMGWLLVALGIGATPSWSGALLLGGAGTVLVVAAVLIIELRTVGLLLAPLGPAVIVGVALAQHVVFDLLLLAAVPLIAVVGAMLPLTLARTTWRPEISRRVRAAGRLLFVALPIISGLATALL